MEGEFVSGSWLCPVLCVRIYTIDQFSISTRKANTLPKYVYDNAYWGLLCFTGPQVTCRPQHPAIVRALAGAEEFGNFQKATSARRAECMIQHSEIEWNTKMGYAAAEPINVVDPW